MAKIIAVHSFRGGTGKSNLIANIGANIALQGQRVGIVDTDIQSPGIHVIFGMNDHKIKRTLNDYLWGYCDIKDTASDVTDVLISEQGNTGTIKGSLYLVPSSIKTGEIARILREGYDVVRLNDGFQQLISSLKLDYLLIDTHPGLNEETLLSIGISNILVILLRPDHQDFQGTAVTVDVARKLKVSKMLLVINKVLPNLNFTDLQQQVEKIYDAPVAGILPLSEEMVQLASQGIFCLRYPQHPISKTIKAITNQIAGLVISR
jgi:MinD-like ATPase involved in chromosome partitioning or flagellar assembly